MGKASRDTLIDFLVEPHSLPGGFDSVEELAKACSNQMLALTKRALENGVLQENTLMVQFIHIAPGDQKIDFNFPTVVGVRHEDELMRAAVLLGSFLKPRTEDLSLFEEATERDSDRPIVALLSVHQKPRSISQQHADWAFADLSHYAAASPPDLSAIDVSGAHTSSDAHQEINIPTFRIRKDFRALVDLNANVKIDAVLRNDLNRVPVKYSRSTRWRSRVLENGDYMRHIFPLTQIGDVMLCAARVFKRDARSTAQSLSGGGCLFVVPHGEGFRHIPGVVAFTSKVSSLMHGYPDLAASVSRGEYRRKRDFILEAAAHVILGPPAQCKQWLMCAASAASSNDDHLRRALASLAKAEQNAEAILTLLPLERNPGADRPKTRIDLCAYVREALDVAALDFRMFRAPHITTSLNSLDTLTINTDPGLLSVVLAEVLRNAFENVVDSAKLRGTQRSPPPADVEVTVNKQGDGAIVIVENGGPVPDSDVLTQLNQPPSLDPSNLLTRKGSTHYGVGTQAAKWIIRACLSSDFKFDVKNGRFVCQLHLTTQ